MSVAYFVFEPKLTQRVPMPGTGLKTAYGKIIPGTELKTNAYEGPIPTPDPRLNKLIIQGLVSDVSNIKSVMYPLVGIKYKYNVETNRIHLWAVREDRGTITPKELAEILTEFNPYGGGPDGWMEGYAYIVKPEISEKLGYPDVIEMIPKLLSFTLYNPELDPRTTTPPTVDLQY